MKPAAASPASSSGTPYPVRLHLAYDARLAAGVRRILVRVLFAWLRERAGIPVGRGGAVVVAQRFGSALNLSLHPSPDLSRGARPGGRVTGLDRVGKAALILP
jgi:hypothetical protein